jgi:hypothetical protein
LTFFQDTGFSVSFFKPSGAGYAIEPNGILNPLDLVQAGCTDKEQPQDIDAYFELELKVSSRAEALEQVSILAHELNSITDYPVPVWNWWQKRPDGWEPEM